MLRSMAAASRVSSLRLLLAEPAVRHELSLLVALAWPTGLATLARQLVPVVDVAVLGRLGTSYLAGASVAQIYITGSSGFVWQSLGSALNTLAAQADGAGEPALVGIWLQTALGVMSIMCAGISLLWAFGTRATLVGLGFPAEDAALGEVFCRWFILYLWPMQVYQLVTNYLQSFGVAWPPLVANVALLAVNLLLNLSLVFGFRPFGGGPDAWTGLGFIGSPIASALTQLGVVLLLVVFIRNTPALHERRWPGWRPRDALAWPRITVFLRQALPGFVAFVLQDFYMQYCSILASEMGSAQIAAHSAFLQMLFALTCLIFGLTKATQVRVAALLGRGDVRMAQVIAALATAACTIISLLVGVTLILLRDVAGRLFSNDPEVVAAARAICLPCGLGYMLVSFFYCARAILAAQGRQAPIALSFLVGAWCVGAPSAIAITRLTSGGVASIWYSLVIGFGCTTLISGGAVLRSDWPELAARAAARAHKAAIGSTDGETLGDAGVGKDEAKGGLLSAPLLTSVQ